MTDRNDERDPSYTMRPIRRRVLQGLGMAGLALGAPALLRAAPAFLRGHLGDPQGSDLFPLGVASGDPTDQSVVLWTRCVMDPFAPDGGLANRPIPLRVTVARDPGFIDVVATRSLVALPRDGHAVNVEVRGLPSNSWLWFRFEAPGLGKASRIGRTRTFPSSADGVDAMRFALVSCQNFEQGYYTAYRDMAGQDVDFVVHTGDYIYENAGTTSPFFPERVHVGPEIFSVADYRMRYAQYRLDADLQDMHALAPFLVGWDDHEIDNNFAGNIAEEGAPFQGQDFLQRSRNAKQVYAETMPLSLRNRVLRGDELRLYRELRFGRLANFFMLDTRQYRDDQPAEDGFGSTDVLPPDVAAGIEAALGEVLFDPRIKAPGASMLGAAQEAWLARRLPRSTARWNVLSQGIMVMRWNLAIASGGALSTLFNVDAWDGYQAAQQRMTALMAGSGAQNPVVLTGDIHSSWGSHLLTQYDDPTGDVAGVEFVCTGISSTFTSPSPESTDQLVKASLPDNPHIAYFEGRYRGYVLHDVTQEDWTASFRAVQRSPSRTDLLAAPDSPVSTDAQLRIEAGFNAPGSGKRLQRVS